MTWEKTDYPGVYVRKMKNAGHGIGKDYTISIRYQFNGQNHQEVVGRASKDNTPKKAFLILSELKENQKQGTPPFTLKDKKAFGLVRQEQEKQKRAIQERENISFADYFNNVYLPLTSTHKKAISVMKEQQHVKNWIQPAIGNLPMKELGKQHVESIKNQMLEKGRTTRTIQYVMATIRQVWNNARFDGLVSGDAPTHRVKLEKFDNRRQRYLTPEECENLLTALRARSEQLFRMSLLSLDTGMRFNEVASLEWQDVNLFGDSLYLRDTKSGKCRTVFMTGRIKEMFRKMTFGKPDELIFPDRNGKKMQHISKTFEETVADIGLNQNVTDVRYKAVFHTLRHTHASRLLESGANIYHVKDMLGHASVTTTERYLHQRDEVLHNALKSMEQQIIQPTPPQNVIRLVKNG